MTGIIALDSGDRRRNSRRRQTAGTGRLLLRSGAGLYVVVGVTAFTAGMALTLVCVRLSGAGKARNRKTITAETSADAQGKGKIMKKRILSALIALCMLMSFLPTGIMAYDTREEELAARYEEMLDLGLINEDGALIENNAFRLDNGAASTRSARLKSG